MASNPTEHGPLISAPSGDTLFTARPRRNTKVGLDVLLTKASIDFQNLTSERDDPLLKHNLEALRESAGLDAVVISTFDEAHKSIEHVVAASGLFATFNPIVFHGEPLERLPYLRSKLGHLRIVEIRDTSRPRRELAAEGARFASLHIGAALIVGVAIQGRVQAFIALCSTLPRDSWDANLHLMLKLLGSSYSSGIERLRYQKHFHQLEERNELALHGANDGLWDFEVDSQKTWFSPRWKAMLGYSDDEAEPLVDWQQLLHPDDTVRVGTALRDHLSGKEPLFESVHRLRHRDGVWLWVESRAKARLDEQGRARRIVGVDLDVTERKLYEEALFKEKESAQITLQSIGDGVITTDSKCRIEYLNPVAEQLTGWRLEHAQGRVIDEIYRSFHEETCEPLENPLAVAIRRTRAIKSVRPTLLIRRDGNELYIESCASPIRDGAGNVSGGVLVFHDVSESRELNRKLSYHASHDILTGLVNRREFESRLERALKSAKAREASYALCHIDLDQFKIINDNCGHSAGDALLGQVGALLKSKIRWRDTVSRLGGDEFGVLLESCSLEEAVRNAEMLREAIRNYKFVWEERTFRLGASIGVVPLSPENEDVASLISAADSACAAAKESGRNRIYSFQENDIDLMRRRREMQWAARINNALEDNRFEIFRQVIQPLQHKEAHGLHYELLLRMRDEAGKIVAPDQFIVAAERYGLTPNIDRWMIEHALRWLVSEADEREKLELCSINLSGQSLGDDKFLPFVIDHFHRSGIDASKICFEITETAAIASFSQANRFIHALKELGCRFALDDFGTGLSSFGYLKHFPVDFLKIDGSFVKEILHDPIDREMVRSINEIGHLTGKQTIAEFAENVEIIEMLRSIGVDYAQGYGIATPQRVMKLASGGEAF
ncbi:EAL domain-containing protein [Peristeroidobacter agariperforans]|uniref:EAL domain-containing protein n=1 Tax=Peristeroidobacter agariperforans TaxID=268404 RepID=UPI00101D0EB0|nr:EAL domain-containing protein [Peristeroidobacter agariperforans]